MASNQLKLAFILTALDQANQKSYDARLVVTLDRIGDVDDSRLTPHAGAWPTGELEEAGFTRELKDALALELMGAAEDGDPDLFDGLSFTGTFGGHYCEVSLEGTSLLEDDDGE